MKGNEQVRVWGRVAGFLTSNRLKFDDGGMRKKV
jgi:hypothetical protein